MRIRIVWKAGQAIARLKNTPTANQLWSALPLQSEANTWGDEIYFRIPIKADLDPDAMQVVDAGTVCFWVEGQSLAIPFGPTPISKGNECRLVTKVNILGRLEGDTGVLKSIREGDPIRVEKFEK
ncbi:MAG: cyclophilin-like fold protein [Nitrospiria bacterium]